MLVGIAALVASLAAPAPSAACDLPKLSGDARLVALRISGGDAVSTVGVAGLNDGTTTGEIRIGPGRGKVQLAIYSNEPVVIRLTGQAIRLSKVVMINRVGAGVVGIPRSKVSFSIGNRCFLPNDPAKLRDALGKAPDVSEDINDLHQAWTDGRRFRHQEIARDYVSAKTDLADKMELFYPGGVMAINPLRSSRRVQSSPTLYFRTPLARFNSSKAVLWSKPDATKWRRGQQRRRFTTALDWHAALTMQLALNEQRLLALARASTSLASNAPSGR